MQCVQIFQQGDEGGELTSRSEELTIAVRGELTTRSEELTIRYQWTTLSQYTTHCPGQCVAAERALSLSFFTAPLPMFSSYGFSF